MKRFGGCKHRTNSYQINIILIIIYRLIQGSKRIKKKKNNLFNELISAIQERKTITALTIQFKGATCFLPSQKLFLCA